METLFNSATRAVIKLGSSLICDKNGIAREAWLKTLADDVAAMQEKGIAPLIVTSGAVALGRPILGLGARKLKLEEKQAAAACGQGLLMELYQRIFSASGLRIAQVLLTIEDSEARRRYLNARNTLETLMHQQVIPVINENDTVATTELRVGDNDRLAARVAQMVGAEWLVLLSDIDGLYTANPNTNPQAEHIPYIETITPEIEAMAGGAASGVSTGGMVTKIAAARIASASGCTTVIAKGEGDNPLYQLLNGAKRTVFAAHGTPLTARKRWIGSSLSLSGGVEIDAGAVNALQNGKSLLPAGVKKIIGSFERGDAIGVYTPEGLRIARGLSAYHAEDAERLLGKQSDEFEAILGYCGREELIHRDDLVLEM